MTKKEAERILKLYASLNKERYENVGKNIVAVLGSFDTWPYMDFTCREIVKLGHYVMTSIREYFLNEKGDVKWKKRDDIFKSVLMRESLRFMIFEEAHKAVIVYSVPGAHYIETEWCFQRLKRDSKFRCYGIALVREVKAENNCRFLKPFNDYSKCAADSSRTAWNCIAEENFCPFKSQGIAKNVIEYFFGRRRMELFAVEKINTLSAILSSLFH